MKLVRTTLLLLSGLFLSAPALALEQTMVENPMALLQQAYNQIRERHYEAATKSLCDSIRMGDSIAARRYLCYSLLQRGYPHEALDQIRVVGEPTGFDLYLEAVASEMMGEPTQAADYFQAAVRKEPTNDFFRAKAVKSLIVLSRYQDAIALCAEGKSSPDAKSRKYYEEEMKRAELLDKTIAQGKACSLPQH